jgi:hypothetical protein
LKPNFASITACFGHAKATQRQTGSLLKVAACRDSNACKLLFLSYFFYYLGIRSQYMTTGVTIRAVLVTD